MCKRAVIIAYVADLGACYLLGQVIETCGLLFNSVMEVPYYDCRSTTRGSVGRIVARRNIQVGCNRDAIAIVVNPSGL